MSLRPDLRMISEWIMPSSSVLDLGCGDGTLLAHLQHSRQAKGYGLEIDIDNVVQCITKGVNVIHSNIDVGLADFDSQSFDYVIMTQTLQAVHYPLKLLNEMLRVGAQGIVTLPNFGHWQCRLQLVLKGRMPVSHGLPHQWYDTPNIHMCTLDDFERSCQSHAIEIVRKIVVDSVYNDRFLIRYFPNLLGSLALYHIRRAC